MPSTSWREPELMEGFIALPGGFFCGWRGRSVFFSEPYRPWAWPPEYILSTSYDVVSAGLVGGDLILFTTVRPVLVSGTRPENMQIVQADVVEPCATPNSVTTTPEGVYFVGRTGLLLATPGSMTNMTRELVSQRQWLDDYQPANLSVAKLNDTQILVLSTAGFGFIVDLANGRTGLIRLENLDQVDSVWNDPYTGEVLLVSNNYVYSWQTFNAPLAVAQWRSKSFHLPEPVNMGACIVSMPSDAREIASRPQVPSVVAVPAPVVEGGPWLDQAAIPNYCMPNTVMPDQGPAFGALPPGAMGSGVDAWPYWFGLIPSDPDPNEDIALPSGVLARLTIYGGDRVAWTGYVENGKMIRPASGFKEDVWRVELVTRVPILRVQMAETGKELASV